jgi:alpha-D-ribose 1-methylphosphonate 5-triphosphate synthase subunit PhnG
MTTQFKPAADDASADRARWMGILARASRTELETALESIGGPMPYSFLRRPERGLVMARARSGGTGQPFNLGELTVARCAVRLADGTVGHAYVSGRDLRHAELAAVLDALLQTQAGEAIRKDVIAPMAARQAAARAIVSRKAAATKVDFFTMARGDNPR